MLANTARISFCFLLFKSRRASGAFSLRVRATQAWECRVYNLPLYTLSYYESKRVRLAVRK